MNTHKHISIFARFFLFLILILGLSGVISAKADASLSEGAKVAGLTPQVQIVTPSYPVGMGARETKLVTFSLTETGNLSGEFTSRSLQFYTQYDVPLSEPMGPYPTNIQVNSLAATEWNELVYLPESVVNKARSMNEYAIVLKTTFSGSSETGTKFSAQSTLLLLLPPDSFGKLSPANGSIVSLDDLSLRWKSSIGAIDYEYCFDTIDNNKCDTDWTGTYWLSTYETFAELQSLPSTTFYWQVRAANLSGRSYADNGKWWSFHTCNDPNKKLITVMNVNDAGPGSLRQAITDVCPGGTIAFAPPLSGQTITLVSTLTIDKNLTINGPASSSKISISGNDSVTVFEITKGKSVTFNRLIITNGKAGEYDGGVFGGGIKNFGTLNIINSTITNNVADKLSSGNGGGIHNLGTLIITNSSITNNIAYYGGGIMNMGASLQITDSTISDNTGVEGGGIYVVASMELVNSTVSNNAADHGGGITSTGRIDILNSTFWGNSSNDNGGGILSYGPLTITNGTFSGNSAAILGGGIYNGNGPLTLINTIIADSTSGGDCYNDTELNGMMGININNLIENNASSPNNCGSPVITADPKLAIPSYDDSFTQIMALLPGSPAIDTGNDLSCPKTDQRGETRPQGSHCDIGAFEVSVPKRLVVKSQALTPSSLTIQSGTTSGSPSSLSLLDQSEADDDPAAYVSFQTPNGIHLGEHSFFLPEDAQTRLISTMLLQVNFKRPASSQVWTWSIYDPNSGIWLKVGDSIGVEADQWQNLVFRIRQPWKYVSPGNEIRIQLKSNNANGDARLDYEALHMTYLSNPAAPMPVTPPVTPRRPGTFSE